LEGHQNRFVGPAPLSKPTFNYVGKKNTTTAKNRSFITE